MGVEVHKGLINPALNTITKVSRGKWGSEEQHIAVKKGLHYLVDQKPLITPLLNTLSNKNKKLSTNVGPVRLVGSPLMVGGGWDKDGTTVGAFTALGFSGVEIGTVPEHAQPGNEKPRQFILADGVAFNRLGFNTPGMVVVKENLKRYENLNTTIGISIGKNKETPDNKAAETHYNIAKYLHEYATYLAINVSSPNTLGLRALQDKGPLTDIVQAVNQALLEVGRKIPVFVKVAPDLTNHALMDVMLVVYDNKLSGIIATNTTINEAIKAKYGRKEEQGGVSGDDPEFRLMAREKTQFIYRESQGRIPSFGVGGIKNADTAIERLKDGASGLQIVTALRSEGIMVASKTNKGMLKFMNREGVYDLREIIGSNTNSSSTRLY